VGLMQLELATARDRGFKGTREQLFDPATSIDIGTSHLAWLMKRHPGETWDGLYAAYNSGKPRRGPDGKFVNSKGLPIVEKHVVGFRAAADHFHPGWRAERVPFGRRGPSSPPAPPAGSSGS
jgi:soluble lytic murein transglycosylase-like protein